MSSSDDDLIAMESIFTKVKRKKLGIHSINRDRITYGEYHHLFPNLKNDNERFFQYMRMSQDTFNYIAEKVKYRLTKNWCNLHKQPILPEERLVITLR